MSTYILMVLDVNDPYKMMTLFENPWNHRMQEHMVGENIYCNSSEMYVI